MSPHTRQIPQVFRQYSGIIKAALGPTTLPENEGEDRSEGYDKSDGYA